MAELEFSVFKEVSEVLDYDVNWTTWLKGDTISTSDWTAESGVTIDSESETTTVATVWLSGGVEDNSYAVVNSIVTAGGRTATALLDIRIIPDAVTIRDGMYNLVTRLRSMTDAGTADATHLGVTYWTNKQLQDRLDSFALDIRRVEMVFDIDYTGGTPYYHQYHVPRGDLEEATSGTARWIVEGFNGNEVSTADYTADYIGGAVRFTNDQKGSARYITARSYDLSRAAASIWREKAAWVAANYDFAADDQRYKRSQWFDHCMKMANIYEADAGFRAAPMVRSDI